MIKIYIFLFIILEQGCKYSANKPFLSDPFRMFAWTSFHTHIHTTPVTRTAIFMVKAQVYSSYLAIQNLKNKTSRKKQLFGDEKVPKSERTKVKHG